MNETSIEGTRAPSHPLNAETSSTIADVLVELQALRAEVLELRELSTPVESSTRQLVDAKALADELGISRQWVYAHRDKLGAIRIGNGPKARLRFNADSARQALKAEPKCPTPFDTSQPRRRHAKRSTTAGSILQIRTTENT